MYYRNNVSSHFESSDDLTYDEINLIHAMILFHSLEGLSFRPLLHEIRHSGRNVVPYTTRHV